MLLGRTYVGPILPLVQRPPGHYTTAPRALHNDLQGTTQRLPGYYTTAPRALHNGPQGTTQRPPGHYTTAPRALHNRQRTSEPFATNGKSTDGPKKPCNVVTDTRTVRVYDSWHDKSIRGSLLGIVTANLAQRPDRVDLERYGVAGRLICRNDFCIFPSYTRAKFRPIYKCWSNWLWPVTNHVAYNRLRITKAHYWNLVNYWAMRNSPTIENVTLW